MQAVQHEIRRIAGPVPADIRRQMLKYRRELRAPYRRSSKTDLLAAIRGVSIVFGGDFHAFAQAQRTHLRILRALPAGKKVALAFECLRHDKQKAIDDYQSGKISGENLRQKLQWDRTWGFPWAHYEPLFRLARERSWRLIGLGARNDATENLRNRDELAAQCLAAAHVQAPDHLIYVLFGELHLCESNLPRTLDRMIQLSRLKIHLNPENVYFDLAAKGLEHETDVVRYQSGNFAVIVSPPWIQWQNYLLYLEAEVSAKHEGVGDIDFTDTLARLIRLGEAEFGLQTKQGGFEVLAHREKKNLNRKLRAQSVDVRAVARDRIKDERSFYLPSKTAGGAAFLGGSSFNHLALLAGSIIFSGQARVLRPLWEGRRDFLPLIWSEAVAFFFSKLINHKRQTESLIDIQSQYETLPGTSMRKDALKIALQQSLNELRIARGQRPRPIRFRPRQTSSWAEGARILGEMMGEKLYIAYASRRLRKEDVTHLIKLNPLTRDFPRFYEEMIRFLAANPVQPKSRGERL